MTKKTNEERILRICNLAEDHFGKNVVEFVGIKYSSQDKMWVAKLSMNLFKDIYEYGDDAESCIKSLKNRIKKIIKRYEIV